MKTLKPSNYLVLALMALVCVAALAPVNFSGEWTLNEQKSNFGDSNFRMGATTLKVKQDGQTVTMARSGTVPNGEAYAWEEKLTADGKEAETTVFGNGKRKSTLKWADDQSTFTISSKTSLERDGNSFEITATETFKLLEGGKVLSVESVSSSSFGSFKRSLVYDKK